MIPVRRNGVGECIGLLEMVARESTGDAVYPGGQGHIDTLSANGFVVERSGAGGLDPGVIGQVVDGYLDSPLLPSKEDGLYLVDEVDDHNGEGTLRDGFPGTNKLPVVEVATKKGQRSIHERPPAECRAKYVHDEPLDGGHELVSLTEFLPTPMWKGGGVAVAFLHPEERVDGERGGKARRTGDARGHPK